MRDWLAGAILALCIYATLAVAFALAARAEPPAMPPILTLVVCKVVLGEEDANSRFTHHRASEWDYSEGVMHCRLHEIELYDVAEAQGADPMPFTPMACMRAAMTLGPQFDIAHKDKPWRFWRAACPVPIRSGPKETDPIIGWAKPACPRKDGTVVCESPSEI
jgi:hypothetical protein